MKIGTQTLDQAKKILSLAESKGKLDEKLLLMMIAQIKREHPNQSLKILKGLLHQLHLRQKTGELVIETSHPLEKGLLQRIKLTVEKLVEKDLTVTARENKNLIVGVKIIQNDTVWENSILSNIEGLGK